MPILGSYRSERADGPLALSLLAWTLFAGVLAATASLVGTVVAVMLCGGAGSVAGHSRATAITIGRFAAVVIGAPLAETVLFVLFGAAMVATTIGKPRVAVFAATMAALGWVMHGASIMAIGPASGYAVLAALFMIVRLRRDIWRAAIATASAHMVWNALFIAIALVR